MKVHVSSSADLQACPGRPDAIVGVDAYAVPMAKRPPRLGSWRIRTELGVAAFAPALALMALRARETVLVWPFAALAVAGVLVLVRGAVVVAKGNPEPVAFGDITDESREVLSHIGAYLLPVVVDPAGSREELWITTITFVIILHIHISTGRVFVNPLLYLAGYRIYSASVADISHYLVARGEVSDWDGPRACVGIGSNVLVEKGRCSD